MGAFPRPDDPAFKWVHLNADTMIEDLKSRSIGQFPKPPTLLGPMLYRSELNNPSQSSLKNVGSQKTDIGDMYAHGLTGELIRDYVGLVYAAVLIQVAYRTAGCAPVRTAGCAPV
jgi:hypothetical protein